MKPMNGYLGLQRRPWIVGLAFALAGCGAAANTVPPGDALDSIEATQLFAYGRALADAGDSIRAEQYLAAAMARGYPEADVLPELLDVCIHASRFSAALSYAEPYLERHSGEWPLRLLVASIQMSLNQTATARSNLERVVEQVPEEPEPHYLLGVILRDRYGDRAGSEEQFLRYIQYEPDGIHVSEARLSIAGRYVPSGASTPIAPPPRTEDAPEREADPEAAPSGPTRLPSHDSRDESFDPDAEIGN